MHIEEKIRDETSLIMLVDDSEPVAEVLSTILWSMGFSTMVSGNGFEAVENYRDCWKDIRLVMLDVNMPGISGRDVFSRLKEINPGVDVIFISGYGTKDEIQSLLDLGGRGFIGKPFSLDALSKSIGYVIGHGEVHGGRPAHGGS
ncbi:MAG: response regulator [Victivallales bacterium]